MTRSALRDLDQLTAQAIRLLGEVNMHSFDPIMHPEKWEERRDALLSAYRDLTLSLDDEVPIRPEALARAVPSPGDDRYEAARGSGGVDVRFIVGAGLAGNPAAHRLYHTDPVMRQGIEVAMGVLSIAAAVLVEEGDTPELAAHIVHLCAHRLSENTPPAGVDLVALGTANVGIDRLHPDGGDLPGVQP